jgi:predicted Zn-dependent protease
MAVVKLLRVLAAPAVLAAAMALPASAQSCFSPMGCIRDAEIEHILKAYSYPLFEAAGLKPDDVNIYLVNDPTINAFVTSGQTVSINTGTIMEADTPEQLKGVIAHETGHMASGINARIGGIASAAAGTSLISIGLGVLAMAAGAPDAGMALIASGQQFGTLTAFRYLRYEETSADQYGLNFMRDTHQSADGFVSFMEKFRYEEMMSESRRQPYFNTHPLSNERISMVRRRAQEISKDALPQSPETIEQLAMMKAKLVGFIGPPAKVYNRYPETDKSIPARYARAINAYQVKDIKKALTLVDTLIEDEPNNPYFQELRGQILFENGKIEESIPYHRRSVELAPEEPLLMVNLARSLIETNKPENLKEAEDMLIVAVSREKDNAFAWNQLGHVYAKQNRPGDADLAVAEEAYAIGNFPRALNFARRASQKLSPDTPNGRRALDISGMADPRMDRIRGRGG